MQKVILALTTAMTIALSAGLGAAASNNAKPNVPGQDRVCLITFANHDQATAGADATIVSTKYLPRKAAEAQADYDKGGAVRIFEYGASTKATCNQLGGRS